MDTCHSLCWPLGVLVVVMLWFSSRFPLTGSPVHLWARHCSLVTPTDEWSDRSTLSYQQRSGCVWDRTETLWGQESSLSSVHALVALVTVMSQLWCHMGLKPSHGWASSSTHWLWSLDDDPVLQPAPSPPVRRRPGEGGGRGGRRSEREREPGWVRSSACPPPEPLTPAFTDLTSDSVSCWIY